MRYSEPQLRGGLDQAGVKRQAVATHPLYLSRKDRHGERHAAAETGCAEAQPERLADCFLSRPQVEEGHQLIGLASHPLQLGRIEPAPSQSSDLPRVHVFDIHADRPGRRRGDRHEGAAVADAHREAVDVRTPVRFVAQFRGAVEERAGEFQQQISRSRALIVTGRRDPHMYPTVSHRKKVTR
jgi:hypothetical protein